MTIVDLRRQFRAVWLVDFEFYEPGGEHPTPICLVAKELWTGFTVREFSPFSDQPVYDLGDDSLFVSYYATAELGCHIALGWEMPRHVLDLYAEFKRHVCGLPVPNGHGLLGALAYFGLNGLETAVKDELRGLAMRGGPYSELEKRHLLDYCATDVRALELLLPKVLPDLDLPRALIRGIYLAALAQVEWNGVPIDVARYRMLQSNWSGLQASLIQVIDRDYGVFEGCSFRRNRFLNWCQAQQIPWPVLPSGQPALDDDTFKDQSRLFPILNPLKELRATLGQMRLNHLKIGHDCRNRCLLSPFASRTSRNQPSNSAFVFGPAVWLRNLIMPEQGRALAYLDFEQQEFGIAAYLSQDNAMMAAYRSGDPYLAFAKQAGAVPPEATKQSHKTLRDMFKVCALAVQYGMQEKALGSKLGLSAAHGRELIQKHQETYPRYWAWSEAVQDHAMFQGWLQTTFGWRIWVGQNPNPRSLRNFPAQANGAEMLRLAIILAHEAGVAICAPVHDALLIEANTADIDTAVALCRAAMMRASEIVLPGFPIRVESKIFRWPNHFSDERGEIFWKKLWSLPQLAGQEGSSS